MRGNSSVARLDRRCDGAEMDRAAMPPALGRQKFDERPVTADSTRGKPTLIAFITTGSLPAQAQVDFLVAMAKHDTGRVNYAVVALESRQNRELVEIYRKSLLIPFPVAMADAKTLSGQSAFGDLSVVPVTVLLDRAGRIAWRVDGRVAKSDELRREADHPLSRGIREGELVPRTDPA